MVRLAFLCLSTASVLPCSTGIIRSELYKIRDTQTPYGVNVQTIVDVSVMLHGCTHCCVVFGRTQLLPTLVSCESLGVTAVCFLLQNIAQLRATASMAMDDQGIVLNGTANIVSPRSPELGFRPVALNTDSMVQQTEPWHRTAAAISSTRQAGGFSCMA
jgi:hypothetical protein